MADSVWSSNDQILKMTLSIEQDGAEKAEEIEVIMEERFKEAVDNEIRRHVEKIQAYYDRREKRVVQQTLTEACRKQNTARLEFLRARYEHMEDALATAKKRLANVDHPSHREAYQTIMADLIVQGLCKLVEKEVVVVVRACDVAGAEAVVGAAARAWRALSGADVKLRVETRAHLSESSCGGVLLTDPALKVRLDNTLSSRFAAVADKVQPLVRALLFPPPQPPCIEAAPALSLNQSHDRFLSLSYLAFQ